LLGLGAAPASDSVAAGPSPRRVAPPCRSQEPMPSVRYEQHGPTAALVRLTRLLRLWLCLDEEARRAR